MNKQQQQEFLSRPCESNEQWVAQTLLQLPAKERHMIVHALRRLDSYLYKSWAKDMTLNEIVNSVNMFSEAKTPLKEAVDYNMEPNTKQPDELKATGEAEAAITPAPTAGEALEGATEDSEEGSTEG